jgi:hypothetical protein
MDNCPCKARRVQSRCSPSRQTRLFINFFVGIMEGGSLAMSATTNPMLLGSYIDFYGLCTARGVDILWRQYDRTLIKLYCTLHALYLHCRLWLYMCLCVGSSCMLLSSLFLLWIKRCPNVENTFIDQIGQIFAYLVIVYFGHFLKIFW